jgi:hypothetical protein
VSPVAVKEREGEDVVDPSKIVEPAPVRAGVRPRASCAVTEPCSIMGA